MALTTAAAPPHSHHPSSVERIAIVSTYAPTVCGLATFAAALRTGLRGDDVTVDVMRVLDSADPSTSTIGVVGELRPTHTSRSLAIRALNTYDVVIIQHEYGIYGGTDGSDIIAVLDGLKVPSIVILHTVLLEPTSHQREVLESVADAADVVVVMSKVARTRLLDVFRVDPAKVLVIPHGATLVPSTHNVRDHEHPTMLTWGLLGPGKGIEHAIDAVATLGDLCPPGRYVVAGRTHPKVLVREGDVYRDMLVRRAADRGVHRVVTFDADYRTVPELTRMIQQSSIVILPYDSHVQVTSGVLVDAIAAGRPVIATAFPHAIEMLSSGAGIVVPHGDPAALASAMRRLLSEEGVAATMALEAQRLAPALSWTAVARQYRDVANDLRRSHVSSSR